MSSASTPSEYGRCRKCRRPTDRLAVSGPDVGVCPECIAEGQREEMEAAQRVVDEKARAAVEAVTTNPQFAHPKFWKTVDWQLADAILKAIEKGQRGAKLGKG